MSVTINRMWVCEQEYGLWLTKLQYKWPEYELSLSEDELSLSEDELNKKWLKFRRKYFFIPAKDELYS